MLALLLGLLTRCRMPLQRPPSIGSPAKLVLVSRPPVLLPLALGTCWPTLLFSLPKCCCSGSSLEGSPPRRLFLTHLLSPLLYPLSYPSQNQKHTHSSFFFFAIIALTMFPFSYTSFSFKVSMTHSHFSAVWFLCFWGRHAWLTSAGVRSHSWHCI